MSVFVTEPRSFRVDGPRDVTSTPFREMLDISDVSAGSPAMAQNLRAPMALIIKVENARFIVKNVYDISIRR